MGLLFSWIVRRRWLTLSGLAIALIGIPIGAMTNRGILIALVIVGAALMFAQVLVSVAKNVKAIREGKPPRF